MRFPPRSKQADCVLSKLLRDWGPIMTFSLVLICFGEQRLLSIIQLGIFASERASIIKMPKFSSQRRKKRKFYGNRFTNSPRINEEESIAVESASSGIRESTDGILHDQSEAKESSASYRKLQSTSQEDKPKPKLIKVDKEETSPSITGFRFCDMEVLSSVFSLLRCGECGDFSLLFMEDNLKRKGCASTLRLLCEQCDGNNHFAHQKSKERVLK